MDKRASYDWYLWHAAKSPGSTEGKAWIAGHAGTVHELKEAVAEARLQRDKGREVASRTFRLTPSEYALFIEALRGEAFRRGVVARDANMEAL